MKKISNLIFLTVFFYAPLCLKAQINGQNNAQNTSQNIGQNPGDSNTGIRIIAYLDSNSMLIGQQMLLHLKAEIPNNQINTKIIFPVLGDSVAAGEAGLYFQVVKTRPIDTLKNPSSLILRKDFTITTFDSGAYQIPAFEFKTSQGQIIKTNPLPLFIRGVAVDTTKGYYDIKQPLMVSYTLFDWIKDNLLWISIALLVLLAVIGLYLYYKNRPVKKPISIQSISVLPPHEVAINKLEILKRKKLWQNGELKLYYSEISLILREYLDERFLMHSQEQATEEIMESLRKKLISKESYSLFNEVLGLSDLVKFAKMFPNASENERILEKSFQIIEFTKEIPLAIPPVTPQDIPSDINKPMPSMENIKRNTPPDESPLRLQTSSVSDQLRHLETIPDKAEIKEPFEPTKNTENI